jgi:NADH-quinone oxidoreductase subunit M
MPDLSMREIALLAPLVAVVFWMGIYPESFLKPMRNDVGALLARLERANPGGDAKLAMGAAPAVEAHAEGAH